MLAQLGDIQFEGLNTPRSWGEGHEVDYGEIPHITGKPALQKTGTPLVTITLSAKFSDQFCKPGEQLASLKQAMHKGEVLPFVTGDGAMVGKFVIVSLDVMAEKLSPLGEMQSVSVEIELREYPEETKDEAKDEVKGVALASSDPIPQSPVEAIPTDAGEISEAAAKGKSLGARAQASLDAVKKGTSSFKRGIREIKRAGEDAMAVYSEARSKVLLTKKIIRRASDLPGSLSEAISYADNLSKVDGLADTSAMQIRVDNYRTSANKVSVRASRVAAHKATKEGGN